MLLGLTLESVLLTYISLGYVIFSAILFIFPGIALGVFIAPQCGMEAGHCLGVVDGLHALDLVLATGSVHDRTDLVTVIFTTVYPRPDTLPVLSS